MIIDLENLIELADAAVIESEDLRSGSCARMDDLSEVTCDPAVIRALCEVVRAAQKVAEIGLRRGEVQCVDDLFSALEPFTQPSSLPVNDGVGR